MLHNAIMHMHSTDLPTQNSAGETELGKCRRSIAWGGGSYPPLILWGPRSPKVLLELSPVVLKITCFFSTKNQVADETLLGVGLFFKASWTKSKLSPIEAARS